MSGDDHFISQLAERLQSQLHNDALEMGIRLLGQNQPDAHHIPHERQLAYIRDSWPDPEFRSRLLQQYGPKAFLAISKQAMEPAIAQWKAEQEAMLREQMAQIARQPMMPPMGGGPLPMPQAQGEWTPPMQQPPQPPMGAPMPPMPPLQLPPMGGMNG